MTLSYSFFLQIPYANTVSIMRAIRMSSDLLTPSSFYATLVSLFLFLFPSFFLFKEILYVWFIHAKGIIVHWILQQLRLYCREIPHAILSSQQSSLEHRSGISILFKNIIWMSKWHMCDHDCSCHVFAPMVTFPIGYHCWQFSINGFLIFLKHILIMDLSVYR